MNLWGRFVYWRGIWRLRFGFCPECNSSPPDVFCWVCKGSYDYGEDLTETRKIEWRWVWDCWYRIEGQKVDRVD